MPSLQTRRTALASAFAIGAGVSAPARTSAAALRSNVGPVGLGGARPFSFDGLIGQAAARARAPYAPPSGADHAHLEDVDYDVFNAVQYRPQMTLWGDVSGAQPVRLFPLGRYFKDPVAIHVVEDGYAREITYTPDLFQAPPGHPIGRLKAGGFAGFRLMNPDGTSDWMAFLGASYFRAAGPFDQYGASARGLAINSGGPGPEEFPRFSAFWLEQDGSGGLMAHALMESPSVVGAYRIANRKTPAGPVQDIDCRLFFRRAAPNLGLAPLTSMFWYGENDPDKRTDWRPEVHDNDALAVFNGAGEHLWRPLRNPERAVTSAFADRDPRGFGLIQRDRAFDNYQDDGVFYDKRPSLWVEPSAGWGLGDVRLVELPTDGETNDNVVAFWTPARQPQAGDRMALAYRLAWTSDAPGLGGLARVVATRQGAGGRPGQPQRPDARKFVIDVQGDELKGLARGDVAAVVSASRGGIEGVACYPVVGAGRWRLMFDLVLPADQAGPIDLRAQLTRAGRGLSETWLYQCSA